MADFFDTIIKSVTLLLISISTGLAIRIYYRNKKVELENSLFKLRLEAIGVIQMEMIIFYQHLDRAKVYLKNPGYLNGKNLVEMSFEIDSQIYKCQASIIKYSPYFSKETSDNLEKFSLNFFGDVERNTVKGLQSKLSSYEKFIIKTGDPILDTLRKEAGIDEIHESLAKRFLQKTDLK